MDGSTHPDVLGCSHVIYAAACVVGIPFGVRPSLWSATKELSGTLNCLRKPTGPRADRSKGSFADTCIRRLARLRGNDPTADINVLVTFQPVSTDRTIFIYQTGTSDCFVTLQTLRTYTQMTAQRFL